MLIACIIHFFQIRKQTFCVKTMYLFDVTVIFVTLNALPFNAVLLLDNGLPKYIIGGFSSKIFLLTVPRRCFFCGSFLLFMFRVCHAFLSVHCSHVVTCWERADPVARFYVKFSCICATFPCGVLGQVWHLIVMVSALCLLNYFIHYKFLKLNKSSQ